MCVSLGQTRELGQESEPGGLAPRAWLWTHWALSCCFWTKNISVRARLAFTELGLWGQSVAQAAISYEQSWPAIHLSPLTDVI